MLGNEEEEGNSKQIVCRLTKLRKKHGVLRKLQIFQFGFSLCEEGIE
jgi:hypothetical protein